MNGDEYVRKQDELYREKGDPWDNFNGPRKLIYRQYHRVIISMILPHYKNVVDMGCGVGGLVNLINSTTPFSAIGVDSSETAIETARDMFAWVYEVGDIRTWMPERPVDMVLSTGSYYHLGEEKIETLEHIKSYLKDGGGLLIAYGGDVDLDGNFKDYPDISDEIFSVFKKQQYARYMFKDGEESGSYVFYVGEK